MYIEQLYTGCLAEAAYYIESNGEAAIIDPIRETEPYTKLAEERGAKIKYIFETHFHADFVSGHIDLAKKSGGTIVYGPGAKPLYDVHVATDNEIFQIGEVQIKAIHTPGHTPESTCYLLIDEDGKDHALFSGDTLFVGDVGRPDLAIKSDPPLSQEQLAGMMYDSLRNKIIPLADDVILYPGHGAGSSCGKNLGPERSCTMGKQKKNNYALQDMSKEDFIKALTEGLTAPPAYFFEDARINMTGYDSIDDVLARNVKSLDIGSFESEIKNGALILDTRVPDDFENGFIPNSINIGLNGSYAVWVGTLIPIDTPMVVVGDPGTEEEAILRLARVGYENVKGYLQGGVDSWTGAGKELDKVESLKPSEFAEIREGNFVLDVRKINEFADNRVAGATNIPLAELEKRLVELPTDRTIYLHCQAGYRSMIASSILKKAGIHQIKNIHEGFAGISKSGVKLDGTPVTA